ncbi:MAG: class I SAM-dependent methyltransferase [Thermoanaerobacteraceae bacterium]|nr:class I SAM-dependent methyltransferase [Thermoanaerobacteraceae bacterium]
MESYTGLAAVYDFLVAGVDFEAWTDYLEEILHRFGHNPRTVLDLACGTGKTTLPLARRGYRVTGMDISPAMVKMAADKAREQGLEVPFFTGDMRSFELAEPVELITCFHDGLNYLPSIGDLEKTFRQVYKNLVPGGLFIGDMNVPWVPVRVENAVKLQNLHGTEKDCRFPPEG